MELSAIVSPLLTWYGSNSRVLPWRSRPEPYRVWISEIMLQQTRVEAVLPYYDRFLAAFPDIASLAGADEQKLLKLWEGLGYYNRARNLQKCAALLLAEYGGALPRSYEKLKTLPGIGSYTAGAIASIAYGIPVPAVDGNVLRLLSRLTASEADVLATQTKREAEQALLAVLPGARAGDFNQALMELGATVCLPNGAPKCISCPLNALCTGYQLGIAASLPVKAAKKARKIEQRTVFVLICNGRVALARRPETGLLAGMYELPNQPGSLSEREAEHAVYEYGCTPVTIKPLADCKHIFTHIEWRMTGYAAEVAVNCSCSLLFVSKDELDKNFPLPSAFSTYRKAVDNGFGLC